MIKYLSLFFSFFLLTSCMSLPYFTTDDDNGTSQHTSSIEKPPLSSETQPEETINVEERAFEDAALGFGGQVENQYLVFFSYEEMSSYISDDDLMIDIDFSRQMVLACFMGEKKSGGYMNLITRIEEGNKTLTVYVEITEPKEGDLVAQMITSPWHAVVTDLSEKTIEWIEVKTEP